MSRAVGVRRFRVTVNGRGGHSWTDWGSPNPIHALGRAVGALAAWPPPTQPTLTLTVSRVGGGSTVNTIPVEAWAEIDVRSESEQHLDVAEQRVRHVDGDAHPRVGEAARCVASFDAVEADQVQRARR